MSTSTKGVVVTPSKDVFFIIRLIEVGLNRVIRAAHRRAHPEQRLTATEAFQLCTTRLVPSTESASVQFIYAGEKRALFVFFQCDSDHADLSPTSISLSLGCWGSSEILMRAALAALAPLGDRYFERSDASEEGLIKVTDGPTSYVECCEAGWVRPNCVSLSRWLRSVPADKTVAQFIGIPVLAASAIALQSYEESERSLKAYVADKKAPTTSRIASIDTLAK